MLQQTLNLNAYFTLSNPIVAGMFPQLDYQKKFVEKKYKMSKENKRRKKKGDKSTNQTDNSNMVRCIKDS